MKDKPGIAAKNRKKAKQMAKNVLPSLKIYSQYIKLSQVYCETLRNSYSKATALPIKEATLMYSDLFSQDYLIGFVARDWLAMTAPGCNAIATMSLEIGKLSSPPIVLVAGKRNLKKNSSFQSIIEHEFVHINQALIGQFPTNFESDKTDLCQQFVNYVYAEYEANFLQLEYWPKLRPPAKYGLSLEEWCFLRGYTQALERLLLSAITEKFSDKKLFSCLNKIPKSLEKMLPKLDADTEIGHQFISRLKVFSFQALQMVANVDRLPSQQGRMYKKILEWIGTDLEPLPQ